MGKRRGIRSLIPTGTLAESEETMQEVPVEQLSRSPFQPRTQVGEEAMAELVASVRMHGILQPLVARRVGGELQLIAGERRLEAARQAGLARVPVLVREASDREMLELALVENLQREDINPMEAAEAYRRLMSEFGLTQEQVGERVGKSRPAVANALRLLRLPEAVQGSLRRGEIDEGHGKVLRRGLSVREPEEAAGRLLGRGVPRGTRGAVGLDPNLAAVQEQLTRRLGAKVRLKTRGRTGVIEIPFADMQDLDRLLSDIMR